MCRESTEPISSEILLPPTLPKNKKNISPIVSLSRVKSQAIAVIVEMKIRGPVWPVVLDLHPRVLQQPLEWQQVSGAWGACGPFGEVKFKFGFFWGDHSRWSLREFMVVVTLSCRKEPYPYGIHMNSILFKFNKPFGMNRRVLGSCFLSQQVCLWALPSVSWAQNDRVTSDEMLWSRCYQVLSKQQKCKDNVDQHESQSNKTDHIAWPFQIVLQPRYCSRCGFGFNHWIGSHLHCHRQGWVRGCFVASWAW